MISLGDEVLSWTPRISSLVGGDGWSGAGYGYGDEGELSPWRLTSWRFIGGSGVGGSSYAMDSAGVAAVKL